MFDALTPSVSDGGNACSLIYRVLVRAKLVSSRTHPDSRVQTKIRYELSPETAEKRFDVYSNRKMAATGRATVMQTSSRCLLGIMKTYGLCSSCSIVACAAWFRLLCPA
jgi:hypothetical protein